MLSIETRVNGELIGYAKVVNSGLPVDIDIKDSQNYFYYVEYHKIGLKNQIINFRIIHNREDGAEGLILKVYQEVDRRLKNTKIPKNKK